jgi:hypothetical protein
VLTCETQDSGRIEVYTRPTAPRSIGGVLDDGLKLWRQAFAKTWPVAIMAQVLVAIPLVIFWLQLGSAATAAQAQLFSMMTMSPAFSLAYLLLSLVSIGFHNAIIAQTNAAAVNVAMSVGESLSEGFRLLGRAFLLGLLVGIGLVVPLAMVFFAFAGASALPRVAFGIVVFLAVCFVLGKVILGTIILVIEDKRAVEALRRSWTLTTGYWWRVATILTVLIIVIAVVFIVVGIIAGIVVAIVGAKTVAATAIIQLISLLGNTLITPLYSAVAVSIYYDLKLRKEGADLAGRVNALATP